MAKFLPLFFSILGISRNKSDRLENPVILPNHEVARFLVSKRHFSAKNQKVKKGAFLPPPNGGLSVFWTHGISSNEIWVIGEKVIVDQSGRSLHGKADVMVSKILDCEGLFVKLDNNPSRHATVEGWPKDKSKQMKYALEIAKAAKFEPYTQSQVAD